MTNKRTHLVDVGWCDIPELLSKSVQTLVWDEESRLGPKDVGSA